MGNGTDHSCFWCVCDPATAYIHYHSGLRRWLLRRNYPALKGLCARDVACLPFALLLCTRFFFFFFWYEQTSSPQGCVIIAFCYCFTLCIRFLLSKIVMFLCNVRINWKYITYGHFVVGDGLIYSGIVLPVPDE